jgi:hypothetical protein
MCSIAAASGSIAFCTLSTFASNVGASNVGAMFTAASVMISSGHTAAVSAGEADGAGRDRAPDCQGMHLRQRARQELRPTGMFYVRWHQQAVVALCGGPNGNMRARKVLCGWRRLDSREVAS